MGKYIKKTILFIVVFALALGTLGCGSTTNKPNGMNGTNEGANSSGVIANDSREVLRVYNAGEYIDLTTVADFEKEFNIRVVYEEFESNESMYEEIVRNPSGYDVLIPSDYMIHRLIQEDRVAKLDASKITNISYVAPQYLSPNYDAGNEYVVPYMVGTLGILYNKKRVSGAVDSWSALWESKYKGEILMWDSMRDAVGPTLKMLGYSMNTTDDGELAQAKARLLEQRSLVQYAGDVIRDKMVADEGALAIVYSGEAKTAIDENPKLAYVVPKEGSNKWVDGFVIMKNTQHSDAAHNFINFMCRPNIAVRNMTRTGYTSPITGAWAEFGSNPIMFPTEEELARCESFLYNKEATQKYTRLWEEVRGMR